MFPLHLHGPWLWTLGARAKEVRAGERASRRVEFVSGPISWLVGWILSHVTSSGNRGMYELGEADELLVTGFGLFSLLPVRFFGYPVCLTHGQNIQIQSNLNYNDIASKLPNCSPRQVQARESKASMFS